MKKLILITLLLLSFAPAAFAHSHLENSTPGNGEVVTEELREIVLTFSGKVEQGSTFELLNLNSKAIPIEEMTITDTEIIGTIPNGLENGKYIVAWNIMSADGHQMDGEFSFEVNLAEAETPPANNTNEEVPGKANGEDLETNQKDGSEQGSEQNQSETVNTNETAAAGDQAENEASSNLIPILVVVFLLVIVIIFIALRRKK